METPRLAKRFVLWIALLILILHVITSAGFIITSFVYAKIGNADLTAMMGNQSPSTRATLQSYIIDTGTFDFWLPLIVESTLYPIINNSFYYDGLSQITGATSAFAIGLSVMWFLLFVTFPTTRKRSKLRMIHIARAMVVCGTLPLLLIEITRVYDILLYIGELWFPLSFLESQSVLLLNFGAACLVIWIQWFWIAAIRVGWKVNAKWWELILVMLASFFGIMIGGLIVLIASAFEPFIDATTGLMGI